MDFQSTGCTRVFKALTHTDEKLPGTWILDLEKRDAVWESARGPLEVQT